MGRDAQGRGVNVASTSRTGERPASMAWGPFTGVGLIVALATAATDQVSKLWLFSLDLGPRGKIPLTPFLNLVLTWNEGISYGLFKQKGPLGQWALLLLIAIALILLWIWLARATSRVTAAALGLIVGGAIGNAVDRIFYGAVADFIQFHITTSTFNFEWYVFNLADAAIVIGVIGLLFETLHGGDAVKAPRS
jgi:signal peptidase II